MRFLVPLLIGVALLIIVFECCTTPGAAAEKPNAFTGSESCRSCHGQEHADWMQSHHFMAMQPATDSTVKGNFNNVVFTADGVTSRFFKKEGKFFIHTQDEKGTYRDMEVKYTFGITPLQQYLVAFEGGRMQATRASWDVREKKWFHQYAGQKLPPNDWLHWTGNGQNWNTMCAGCHSTNVQKGYNPETDQYNTTYNEISVGCESCHGPGKLHMDYINSDAYKAGKKTAGSLLQLYRGGDRMTALNTCGYCHARRSEITGNPFPGSEVLDDYIPELPVTPYFFPDGQMLDEDYNYTSFLQSKMFHRGVQCTNCHNPHSGGLKADGALVCGQCHAQDTYAAESHTLHKAGTVGVNCISCHMPARTYMGNDERHDHSFRVPRPDLSAQYGIPNTCNSCHAGKSAQWAAAAIEKGYGRKPGYHWSEDLIPGSKSGAHQAAHLNRLLADTAVPNMVRAAALHYMAAAPNAAGYIPALTAHVRDTSALVRFTALKGLRSQPYGAWIGAIWPLLSDKVRGVRIAAADLLLELPPEQVPPDAQMAFSKAKSELERFMYFQTDFAQGSLQAGDYFRRIQNLPLAEKFYLRAIAKDSQLVLARINLASTLNVTGKNGAALQQLQTAGMLAPDNDHVFYSLGLLYAETGDMPKAEQSLQQAFTINPSNLRAGYNLAVLLAQQKRADAAEKAYLAVLKQDPTYGDALNALTILYLQQGEQQKALQRATELRRYHANNPQYAQVLSMFK